jgi:dTMP kinase
MTDCTEASEASAGPGGHAQGRLGMSAPRIIALVGIDGSGKTTQAHRLADDLAREGLPAVYRRNAGGRHWFGKLANRLGRADADALLGRRAMLFVESVLRWLAILRALLLRTFAGRIAVMDRYAFCQYASLRARGAAPAAERRARFAYRPFPRPDVTFLLSVDPRVAQQRVDARGYDHETLDHLTASIAAYRSLPEYADFVVIDANGTPDEVAAAIRAHLPLPARPPRDRRRAGALLVAGGSLITAGTALGYQLVETF